MDNKIDIKNLFTTAQVAEMLHTSSQVIRNLVCKGQLVPCKQGRYLLFTEQEVLNYMQLTLKPNKLAQQEEIRRIANQDWLDKRLNQNRTNDKKYS